MRTVYETYWKITLHQDIEKLVSFPKKQLLRLSQPTDAV